MSCIDLGFYTISPFKLMWEVGRHSAIYALHHPLYSLQESIYGRGLGRDRFDSWKRWNSANASRFVMFYYALLAHDSHQVDQVFCDMLVTDHRLIALYHWLTHC